MAMARTKRHQKSRRHSGEDDDGSPQRQAKRSKGSDQRDVRGSTEARGQDLTASLQGASPLAPEAVISQLLGGMPLDEFKAHYFEKKPLLVKGNASNPLYESRLFSRKTLLDVIGENNLEFQQDMTVCRFAGGERENYTPDGGHLAAKKDEVSKLLDKGYSCQFYQPQRHVDGLFHLNAAFESVFGCLVGSSAYLTPPASQALAPHHDDVEVFILQTEGRKKWKLYHPLIELAGEHSSDLAEEQIGDVWMELTLEQGDMLYFPRGVIHQASTDDDQFSTHVTISAYQHNTWANFLEVALPRIIRRAFDSDVAFRRGLPIQYLGYMGSQFAADSDKAAAFENECKKLIVKLGSSVDMADLHVAADAAALDFVANRLPPQSVGPLDTAEFLLESNVNVRLRDRSHVRLVLSEDEDSEPVVTLYHSFRNCRTHHMGRCSCAIDEDEDDEDDDGSAESKDDGDDEGGGSEAGSDEDGSEGDEFPPMAMPPQPQSLVFPGNLATPLMKLYSDFPSHTSVTDLVKMSGDETEIRGMLLRLWSEELLEASK